MSYTHLTENDRHVISHLHGSGISVRERGRGLERAPKASRAACQNLHQVIQEHQGRIENNIDGG